MGAERPAGTRDAIPAFSQGDVRSSPMGHTQRCGRTPLAPKLPLLYFYLSKQPETRTTS